MRTRLIAFSLLILLILSAGCLGLNPSQEDMENGKATPTPSPTSNGLNDSKTSKDVDDGLSYRNVYKNIYKKSIDSVVSIRVFSKEDEQPLSGGTGFVYNKKGYIVTNHHVVEDGGKVEVTFNDGSTFEAQVVGVSEYNDLAVLRINPAAHDLKPLPLGNSTGLQEGTLVVALGNPLGLSGTMTHGIVSALNRTLQVEGGYGIPGTIQTDAPINPGNSGGPLLNLDGEVVGVNRAKAEAENIGFAIPSDIVKKVVPVLIEKGNYRYPWIGVQITNADTPKGRGVQVVEVVSGSPAEKAGLKSGDVLLKIDETRIRTGEELLSYLALKANAGEKVVFEIYRDGETIKKDLTLGERS